MAGRKQFPRAKARKALLKQAIETSGTRIEELAVQLDCSASHLLKVVNARIEVSKQFADQIAKAVGQKTDLVFEVIQKSRTERLDSKPPPARQAEPAQTTLDLDDTTPTTPAAGS